MGKANLTAEEIRRRLEAGERVWLYGNSGAHHRITGVDGPAGNPPVFNVAFKGRFLDVAPWAQVPVKVEVW